MANCFVHHMFALRSGLLLRKINMSFLNPTTNLDGWKYREYDLHHAQKKIKNVLALYAPDWNQCPEGELASHWAIDNPQSVCFLIWIAQVLYKLDCAKTEKSVNVFAEKIKQLMKLNLYQLTEALRELEIGAALSERFSPISFEPYVPVDNTYDSKPISPDYGIKLPEGWVDIESTVFRLGKLQSWDKKYLVS